MKKVLILDDEHELLRLWVEQFKLWDLGVEVITAANGVEGLERLKAHGRFDLIITDFMMPEMDGIDFVKEVRKTNAATPVCFFTGYLPELSFFADELGNTLLFEKPMISQKMKLFIRQCLQDELTPVEAI